MKKLIGILMSIIMVTSLIPAHAEYAPQFEYEAQMLYDMGLFKGTENGFELDRKCNRLEAAALFIRLLGKEEEARSNPKEHPFTDVPEWASSYVGQMYHDGYTKGISETEYGVGDVTANQFAAFCLRALGFSDSPNAWVSFNYEEAFLLMLTYQILRPESYDIIANSDTFYRDYAVKMAYNTLFTKVIEEPNYFLIRTLVNKGVLDGTLVASKDLFVEDNIRYYYSPESFKPYFENMIREAAEGNKVVSVVNKCEDMYVGELHALEPDTLLSQELLYRTVGGGLIQNRPVMADDLKTDWESGMLLYSRTTIDPTDTRWAMTYRCIRYITHGDIELTDIEKQVVEKTKEFLSTITDGMSDYDKYKAAYDYIAENVKYGNSYKVADVDSLVYGETTCGGYAQLYMYLCRLMGLECWSVGGITEDGLQPNGGHAWNKVKLDGKYYNVDATWNGAGSWNGATWGSDYKYFLFKDLAERKVYEFDKIFDFPCTEDYQH